jgi:hypothetical protein
LPLVYRKLVAASTPDPWLGQMQGLHRYHWLRNARRQRGRTTLVKELNEIGVTPVLLKGHALLEGGYYGDLGQRPMLDTDIMVAPHESSLVESWLSATGWQCERTRNVPFPFMHARSWSRKEDGEVDLHLKLLQPPFGAIRKDHILQSAQKMQRDGAEFYIPDATDMLLHVCVHGRLCWGRDPSQPFLWVIDACHVLAHAAERIDWQRLREESLRVSALFPVRESLGYLAARFAVAVPEDWLAEVRAIQLPREQLRPFFRWIGPPNRHPSLMELLEEIGDDYRCVADSRNQHPSATGLAMFALRRFGKSLLRGVAFKRAFRIARKLLQQGYAGLKRPDLFQNALQRLDTTKRGARSYAWVNE